MKKLQLNINKSGRYSVYLLSAAMLTLAFSSCKKELDVKNPNSPTFDGNVTNLNGLTKYAKGSVYWNGFNYGNGWLGDSYFSLPWGYRELMGDEIGGGQGSNNQTTTMGVPDKFQADPSDASTVFTNPSPQATGIIRGFNTRAATANANNALFYQWNSMYALISSCNLVLENMGRVKLTTDQANTIKAWAYWWKGFAYAEIGSLYYAGLIIDQSATIVSKYSPQADIIAESNKYLNLASTTLGAITNQADYADVVSKLIPLQNQVGLGEPPSSAEWKRTINTMLARNILVNHLAPYVNGNPNATINKASIAPMSSADWNAIITLCNNGIKEGDHIFTGRTSEANSFFSTSGGSVAGMLTQSNQVTTYKLSERLVQQFKTGDARRANFSTKNGTFFGDANTNTTRYTLLDGIEEGFTDFKVLGTREIGELEIYIGPSFEENELMLAEAKIRTGNIDGGLAHVDNVREYQGAGVADVSGTGLNLSQALKELTMERLAALSFQGMSYYDTRRWGWTYSIANGGGRYGCVINYKNTWYTNATIEYNFMDYWDVPADELELNPAATGSAAVKNPNW